jgi:hypothetical protein
MFEVHATQIDVLSASTRPITVLWFTAAMFLQPAVLSSTKFQEQACSTGAPAPTPPVGVPPSSVGPAEGTTLQDTSISIYLRAVGVQNMLDVRWSHGKGPPCAGRRVIIGMLATIWAASGEYILVRVPVILQL